MKPLEESPNRALAFAKYLWASNRRILGILVIVVVLYGLIQASDPNARTLQNHQNLGMRLALYGVMTIGVGTLIISGGIDLSIGSVVALSAVSLGLLLNRRVPDGLAVATVLLVAAVIGVFHGVLVTRLRLQPFIVTLCGLFIYRGVAYWLAMPNPQNLLPNVIKSLSGGRFFAEVPPAGSAGNVGIAERSQELSGLIFLSKGYPSFPHLAALPVLGGVFRILADVPMRLWLMLGIACLVAVLLHFSVYGRYLYAIGSNEQAARYAGIATDRYKIFAYVLCSLMAAVCGMMEMLDLQTASPSSTGNWYELYAITGAVLGGCSLRGGEGTVIGMILGTAVLPLLRNLINFSSISDDLQFLIIGVALLLGTITDELLKRRATRRV
jgi:ribose transport system permease protein